MNVENVMTYSIEVAPYLLAGFVAGKVAESIALEAYAHQALAHRTVQLHPAVEDVSRSVLVLGGMSPNLFAAEHRMHHAQDTTEPSRTTGERLRHVLRSGGAVAGTVYLDPMVMLFPGYSFADDPLIRQTKQGALTFRHNGPIERLVAKGLPANLLPLVGATAMTAYAMKRAGQKHPIAKSIALFSGYQAGLTTQAIITSYAEGRAGRTNNRLHIQSLPKLLRPRIVRHQQHHEAPEVAYSGSATRHKVTGRILASLGLLQQLK